jgi:peptide/nickel transport system ATP-binding protein
MTELVRVENLTKEFPGAFGRPPVHAVAGVSFTVGRGESVGLVGESGSGKTTTGRIVCGIETATAGTVHVAGLDLHELTKVPRDFYRDVQMVFQDPYLSLNPRMTVGDSVGYTLRVRGVPKAEQRERVRSAIARVGLAPGAVDRYPHQLSTGQRQRVGIARAVISEPKLIVADEPVSSLDVSLQTQILNLLLDIQDELGVSYLFISHDLGVVSYLCDRVLVMKDGVVVEEGDAAEVFARPKTAYARLLVEAADVTTGETSAAV